MDCLYIVIPAYNEEKNIREVVTKWYKILVDKSPESKIIIADSGSIDSTHKLLEELKVELPQIEIISDTAKEHGPKLIALYKLAILNNCDYVFQTDSDGQTDPEEFESFWKLRTDYDLILGYRKKRGDGKARAFVEYVVCFLLKLFFGVNVPDANAPFRLMKTSILKKYIKRFKEDYNLPNVMLTTFFAYYRENLCFREISFKPRQGGVNSINLFKIFRIGINSLKDFSEFKKTM